MKNKSDFVVAILVMICSVVLLAALVFAISGNPFHKPHLRFSVDFEDLTGISENSDVLYSGNRVGVVDRVEHLPKGDRIVADHPIRAHVSILEQVPIPENLEIAISAESMLGEKHIALRRTEEEGALLADGARLLSSSGSSMLELMVPGGGAILENIRAITASLKDFTEDLGRGTARKDIGATLANIKELTENLKRTISGDDESPGLTAKLGNLADNLDRSVEGVRVLIEGPEGSKEEGLAARGKIISGNLVEFSEELNVALMGEEGEPGLSARVDEITAEVHAMIAGNDTEEGLRKRLDTITAKVDTLVEELNALIVWGEYFTGTLAEKPNRLIFGNKENDVPTKDQIIEYLRKFNEPYPVRIKENDPEGDPNFPGTNASAPAEEAGREEPKKRTGIFRPKNRP